MSDWEAHENEDEYDATAVGQSGSSAGTAQGSDKSACESLAALALPNAKISAAQSVAAGAFVGPPAPFSGEDLSAFYKKLPAFCRFAVDATPTADSDIKIEVWLPASGWNGRLQGIGNGGFAGQIDYPELGSALSHGFAAVATDTGHSGNPTQAAWALGHPEKVIDFGHRGIHEMTRVAKAAVQGFYGNAPQHSYFAGCSDGGREALMEAQRYPEDYDGILAGAPANYWTRLLSTAVVDTQALTLDPASFIPPAFDQPESAISESTSSAVLIFLLVFVPFNSELDQAVDQIRVRQPGCRPQLGIHADRGESRHGIDLVQVNLSRLFP